MRSQLQQQLATFFKDEIYLLDSYFTSLRIGLQILDLKPGDEVCCYPLISKHLLNLLITLNVSIKWVDISLEYGDMCLDDLTTKLTLNTKLIIVSHFGGFSMDDGRMERFKSLKSSITVLEECRHSLLHKDMSLVGDIVVWNLGETEPYSCGSGGCIMSPNPLYKEKVASLLQEDDNDDITSIGFICNMSNQTAKIGLDNLANYNPEGIMEISGRYRDYLYNVPGCVLFQRDGFWCYPLQVINRDGFVEYMKERGVVLPVFQRLDTLTITRAYQQELPNMDTLCRQMVCLPLSSDYNFICNSIRDWCGKYMRIRSLQLTDLQAYFEHLGKPVLNKSEWTERYEKIINTGDSIFVMEHSSRLIASIRILTEYTFEAPVMYLKDVVVDENWRDKGIDRALIHHVSLIGEQQQFIIKPW
jgi:dTDP-4-amino-4,6-dideoxygalactose transaminase